MKIGIVSDSHDRADPLARAVHAARAAGAEAIIHCGDLIGAQTIKPALEAGLPVHAIHGNNLGDPRAMEFQSQKSGGQLRYHGPDAILQLGGRSIFVVHYDNYGFAFACTGEYDLVCCGHSHKAEARQVANAKGGASWLVNPGTVAGLSAPATWVLGDLAAMRFEIFSMPA